MYSNKSLLTFLSNHKRLFKKKKNCFWCTTFCSFLLVSQHPYFFIRHTDAGSFWQLSSFPQSRIYPPSSYEEHGNILLLQKRFAKLGNTFLIMQRIFVCYKSNVRSPPTEIKPSQCAVSPLDSSPGSAGSSAHHQPWAPSTDLITTM